MNKKLDKNSIEDIQIAIKNSKNLEEAAKKLGTSRRSMGRTLKDWNGSSVAMKVLKGMKAPSAKNSEKVQKVKDLLKTLSKDSVDCDLSTIQKLQKENAELKARATNFPTNMYQVPDSELGRRNDLVKIYHQKLKNFIMKSGKKSHFVLPDCQVKQGVDLSYLADIAKYIIAKKPDRIICIGDFGDFPSLSSYDKGKKSHEGKRYIADLRAVHYGMHLLMMPILEYIATHDDWCPTLDLTYGNHEERILRAINEAAELEGTMAMEDCHYEKWGWNTHVFLKPVVYEDIAYAHYFTSGTMGRPVSSARALILKKHMSCVMGHVQDYQLHREVNGAGIPLTGLFVGACYLHNEDYLGPQGNTYWRGCWILHEVEKGSFQPHQISLSYLKEKYKGV